MVIGARHVIPLVFLGTDAESEATATLAAFLLAFGATFYVADSLQTVAAGALRGLNDTRVPMIFSAVSFWAVGFIASYTLAFQAELGAVGVWAGFTLGLGVYASLLVWRFNLLTRRGYMPAVPGHAAPH